MPTDIDAANDGNDRTTMSAPENDGDAMTETDHDADGEEGFAPVLVFPIERARRRGGSRRRSRRRDFHEQ